jgi:Grx4 family monothiol glutaredoxin
VEAEKAPDVSESFEISAVPCFILLNASGIVGRVDGAHAAQLTSLVEKHAKSIESVVEEEAVDINTRLRSLVNRAPVMVFIKGTPAQPRCGFSRKLIQLLSDNGVVYGYFDILSDEQVRQGLKTFSDWPTYPQVYVKGELQGGLDIVKELIESGEFVQLLK